METIYIVGPRPQIAPEGWIIWNAPRPLYGAVTWTGDFITGCFYAAQKPDNDLDPLIPYETVFRENSLLHACELIYISADEFKRRVSKWSVPYAEKMGIDLGRFDFATIAQSFVNLSKDRYLIRSEVK